MNKYRKEAIKKAKKDVMDLRRKLWGITKYEERILVGYELETAENYLDSLRTSRTRMYLQERLSHNYSDGYAHLDQWGDGGAFLVLRSSDPKYDPQDMYGERWARFFLLKQPANMTSDKVVNTLMSTFSKSCRCEHDCCGCVHSYVNKAKKVKRQEWLVEVRYCIVC